MGGLHRVSRENLAQLHTWKSKAARNLDGIGRTEEKYEMMGADLKSSFAFAFAFADCQVKSTPFLLQSSKDTVSAGPNAPAPVYLST